MNKIKSVNVNGVEVDEVVEYVKDMYKEDMDMVVMTETHWNEDKYKMVKEKLSRWKGISIVASCYKQKAMTKGGRLESVKKGVAIIWKHNVVKIDEQISNDTGEWCRISNKKMVLWAVYAPVEHRHKVKWWYEMWEKISECEQEEKIVTGDFNAARQPKHKSGEWKGVDEKVQLIMNEGQNLNGMEERSCSTATWMARGNREIWSIIDRTIMTGKLWGSIKVDVKFKNTKDHSPIIVEMDRKKKETRKSPLPEWVLNDQENKNRIEEELEKCSTLEEGKIKIEQIMRSIEEEYKGYKKAMNKIMKRNVTHANRRYWQNQTEELWENKLYHEEEYRKWKMNMRRKEDQERLEDYMLKGERVGKKLTRRICKRSGVRVMCSMEKIEEFYEDLYNVKESKNSEEMLKWVKPISEEDKEWMEGTISRKEFEEAVKNSKETSAAGPDGLKAGIFKRMTKMRELLWISVNKWYDEMKLEDKEKIGKMAMLKKEDNIVKSPAGVRPITMMNVSYKVYTVIITNRIMKFIGKYINNDQIGFMKGRFIIENVMQMKVWQENIKDEEQMLFLDFQKAYDRVSHEYLKLVLERMNFGEGTINRIMDIYKNSKFTVNKGNEISKDINFGSGVKQGDPLSPILFNLTLEPLLESLRNNIKGIAINGEVKKVSAYADDIMVMTEDDEDRNMTMSWVSKYQDASGARLRPDKSKYYGRGKSINNFQEVKKESDEYLGYCIIGNSLEKQVKRLKIRLENIKNRIGYLTMLGKINILNAYGISMLYYFMYATENEKTIEKYIKNMVRWFMFSNEKKFDEERKYIGHMSKEKMEQIGLIDWIIQWRSLRIAIGLRFLLNKSVIGNLIEKRLNEIKWRRDMDVWIIWADKGNWSNRDNKGIINNIIKDMFKANIMPWHDFYIGDRIWTWKDNIQWMEGEVKEIIIEGKLQPDIKFESLGEEKEIPISWGIKSMESDVWRSMSMAIYVKEENRAYEVGKVKPKTNLIKKGIGGKNMDKKIKKIKRKDRSNKIKSFEIKREYGGIRTRSTRHGVEEQERKCKLCDMQETETWEHVLDCKRTKEIRRVIDDVDQNMKEIYKQWTMENQM